MTNQFDEDYFLRGPATGKSNYQDYRWLEDRTMAFAVALMKSIGIRPGDTLLDYGTARGFTVKALRRLGVLSFGYDISTWAIENCDLEVIGYVSNSSKILSDEYDYVLCKDCAEHLELPTLRSVADILIANTRKSILVIVPLSFMEGTDYVRKEDNQDSTHIIRWPLQSWMDFFQSRVGDKFSVSGSWHLPGLKPTSLSHIKSCGFVTLSRISS